MEIESNPTKGLTTYSIGGGGSGDSTSGSVSLIGLSVRHRVRVSVDRNYVTFWHFQALGTAALT